MARIGNKPPSIASSSQVSAQKPASAPKATAQASTSQGTVKAGWSPGAGKAARAPAVAPEVTELLNAYKSAGKAMNQMDMVSGSVDINNKADALLKRVGAELASQLSDRGQEAKGDKVLKDLDTFFKDAGPARGYRMDPERGTMASLEDNGFRMTKVMGKLSQLADQLDKVNKEPAGEWQQAMNRSAGGEAVEQQARFALAFEKAYHGDKGEKALSSAVAFLKALPAKIDAGIESRGGSLEPLERAGGTAAALEAFAKNLN
jgi:hypothetical protein